MRLLIADRLRRTSPWVILFVAAFAGGMWWAGPSFEQPGRALTTSMAIVLMGGPLTTLWFIPRNVWYLPVSRRDIWRANWLVAVVGLILLMTAAKVIAWLVPATDAGRLPIASVALSALFDFAAAGAGCGLVLMATRPRPSGQHRHTAWAIAKGVAEFTLPVCGLAVMYLPGWTGWLPPARWSEVTPATGVLLMVAVGFTITTWFHVPTPLTPSNRLAPPDEAAKTRSRVRASTLSGMPRLLIREAAWVFAIAGSLAVGGALIVMVMAGVVQDRSFLRQFLHDALRIADSGGVSRNDVGYVAFNLLIWYALFASATATRFPLMLRHLRVLPFSVTRLNALLVAWPALIWITAWVVGTGLYYAVVGHAPTRPHVPTIVALTGICALVQAISLRFSTVTRLMNFATGAGLVPFAGLINAPPPAILTLFGVATLAAAAAINRSALARNSTYKAAPLPIGTALGP